MTTVVEDCQFVCITQADYYKILHEGEDALVREEDDNGELVKVSEVRRTDDGQRHAKVTTLWTTLRPTSNNVYSSTKTLHRALNLPFLEEEFHSCTDAPFSISGYGINKIIAAWLCQI